MIDRSNPFYPDRFALKSCELVRMADKDALAIAIILAGMDPWQKLGYGPEGLAQFLLQNDPFLHRYKIMISGKLAGVFCIQYPWLRGAYIALFAVFEPHSGKGVGAELVNWLAEKMRGRFRNLWALVSSFNARARGFYSKQGFAELAALKGLVHPGYDEILVRKMLE